MDEVGGVNGVDEVDEETNDGEMWRQTSIRWW